MPVLPYTDENTVPVSTAHHKDEWNHAGLLDSETTAPSLLPNSKRIALGDVTSQANIPLHKSQTGLYSRPLNVRDTHVRDTNNPSWNQSLEKSSPVSSAEVNVRSQTTLDDKVVVNNNNNSNNNINTDHDIDENDYDKENGDTSSVLSDSEPLLLLSTDESRSAIQLAHQQLHTDGPDPLDEDTYDLVMVVEYSEEIFQYLHELEVKFQPHPRYMHFQPELKWSYRSTLIDWIVQVHARFQLLPETLYLTVNIIDRFLSRKTVTLNRFQLVGAAALFLAAKFEEINCPTLKEILYMLDNSYSKDELLKAERYMINTLEFELGWPGPMSFLRRVSKADDYEYDIRTLAKYLLETTIMDSRLASAQPSWLASGAYYLSRVILGLNEWSQQHIYYSNYTAEQLFPLATIILENCRYASKRHQAIFEKYSERRHRRSSQVVARWIAMAEQRVS
ncbi:LANO_0E01618g1_1 [Lachancea nothofagi CBS 11611]|uniref:LANO_0E01618g1_1 n=1 Tax=Lachancea nothofagi CBS 11611 TaxID=1266666 RepID=A0A1G4JPK1_9SACH|nr:LANO_0E01618g1_1 [Lachancea nothofagi CBS 11611]